jgi:hypothetical protein
MDLKARILSARDRLRVEDVTDLAPELAGALGGERLYLRELTAAQRDAYEAHRLRQRSDGRRSVVELHLRGTRGLMLALTLCDQSGKLLFREQDADELGGLPAAAADRLFEKALAMNGMDRQADEELAKNLSRGGGDGSPSPSPASSANGTSTACSP